MRIAHTQLVLKRILLFRFNCSDMTRLSTFYLPQFRPIPENDHWRGKGFTEWTNVAKAQPLFPDYYQPHVPADLGNYDLRISETRQWQADMARAYGVDAFCYYHYWFADRRLLELPFNEVLSSAKPHFPFFLCWANHTCSRVWHGALAPRRSQTRNLYFAFFDLEPKRLRVRRVHEDAHAIEAADHTGKCENPLCSNTALLSIIC
jgi:lipopolysaccharide biosynthesis protein